MNKGGKIKSKKISIIVPVFNEEKTIGTVLERVNAVDLSSLKLKKEIIVVDDGSTDSTATIAEKSKGIKLLRHKKNRGKGAAIKTGIKNSTGDIIVIQDADLEYNPEEIPKLIRPIINGKEKVVYGSRFMGTIIGKQLLLHNIGNKVLSLITALLYNANITDMETGYKAFESSVIKNLDLKVEGFDIEPEITAKLLKKGYVIKEIPITYRARGFAEGKKINWKDGIEAFLILIRCKLE